MSNDVVVKQSKIAGKGVFAARDFTKGDTVLAWYPKILTKTEFDALPANEKHYVYNDEGIYLYMQAPEKFMNHSCDSNTRASERKDVAIRAIKKGEEITADYNNDGVTTFQCNCGSKQCRGLVS